MPIQFKCEFCSKTLKTDESKAGKRVKCPACQAVITIPQPVIEPEPEEDEFPNFGSSSDYEDQAEENPYVAPAPLPKRKKKLDEPSTEKTSNSRATRDRRWLSAVVDNLIGYLIIGPGLLMMMLNANPNQQQFNPPNSTAIVGSFLFFIGCAVAFLLNCYMYSTRSQSVGKWLLKLKVMDSKTDQPAGLLKGFIVRGALTGLIALIPNAGNAYALIDALFIFGGKRKCLHDRIAGTYVVDMR